MCAKQYGPTPRTKRAEVSIRVSGIVLATDGTRAAGRSWPRTPVVEMHPANHVLKRMVASPGRRPSAL